MEKIEESQPVGATSDATTQEEQAGNKTTAIQSFENQKVSGLNETGPQQNSRVENDQPSPNRSEELPRPTENLESTINNTLNETQISANPPVNFANNTLNENSALLSQSESSEYNPRESSRRK